MVNGVNQATVSQSLWRDICQPIKNAGETGFPPDEGKTQRGTRHKWHGIRAQSILSVRNKGVNPSSAKRPFRFHLQSSSPVLGCLFAALGLILALMVAVIGFFAALIMPVVMLVMRLAGRALARPDVVQVRQSEAVAIDVESTVLPPERITG